MIWMSIKGELAMLKKEHYGEAVLEVLKDRICSILPKEGGSMDESDSRMLKRDIRAWKITDAFRNEINNKLQELGFKKNSLRIKCKNTLYMEPDGKELLFEEGMVYRANFSFGNGYVETANEQNNYHTMGEEFFNENFELLGIKLEIEAKKEVFKIKEIKNG